MITGGTPISGNTQMAPGIKKLGNVYMCDIPKFAWFAGETLDQSFKIDVPYCQTNLYNETPKTNRNI